MNLYLFNPEHDYALANNDAHFMAPASAVKFADDCALFLRYLVEEDGFIFHPYRNKLRFYNIQADDFTDQLPDIEQIIPWGWDTLMRQQCLSILSDDIIGEDKITKVRMLSHRERTIDAMNFLRDRCEDLHFPAAAQLLRTTDEVANFVQTAREVILKSPYSGNGRGNLYAHNGHYSPTLLRQTSGVIRRQGAILGEPLHQVVQDFAMEFLCHNGTVAFAGYSLFSTKHYGYAGNELTSDDQIMQTLSQWISIDTLQRIQQLLTEYLQDRVAPHYNGYLGVDMFVYEQDGKFKLNPMVEMNIRMTMGMAAHILYEKHVHADATGCMWLEYNPKRGELQQFAQSQPPMKTVEDRWRSGFMTLNPIDEATQYAVCVKLQ